MSVLCIPFDFQSTFLYETNNRTYGHTAEVLVTVVLSNINNKPEKQNLISHSEYICYLIKSTLYKRLTETNKVHKAKKACLCSKEYISLYVLQVFIFYLACILNVIMNQGLMLLNLKMTQGFFLGNL